MSEKQYFLLIVWEDIEPDLMGPFQTEEERDANAKEMKATFGDENGIFFLDLSGSVPSVGAYSGGFFKEE